MGSHRWARRGTRARAAPPTEVRSSWAR